MAEAETHCRSFCRRHFKYFPFFLEVLYLIHIQRRLFLRVQMIIKSALFQIMHWRRTGDTSLSEQIVLLWLTHLSLDKMTAISQTTFSRTFLWMKKFAFFFIKKCVPKDPIKNNQTLVLTMTWRRIGDEPLPEPILTRFTHAYMQH